MKQLFILFLFLSSFANSLRAEDKLTQIHGFAPKYIGKQVEIYQITDYLSMRRERIASAIVQSDSMFHCNFFLDQTRKLLITSENNEGEIIGHPGSEYTIYLPLNSKYDAFRPLGNKVEIAFSDLDSTDINYKILAFNKWMDNYLFMYYTKKNADSPYFVKRVDSFKVNVERYYKADSADLYFMAYLKFSIAKIDDLKFLGNRNQFEKFDHYLREYPVQYQVEPYMDYVNHFYELLLPRLHSKINEQVYQGLLKSSPTLIMNALSEEYTLQRNRRLRELVMIKLLGEAYNDKEYPATNISTVLDSISRFALYAQNRVIASNVLWRLTELSAGSKAPDFVLNAANGSVYDLNRYRGKFLYLFFVDPASLETKKQIELLVPIFQRYTEHVRFLMVIQKSGKSNEQELSALQKSLPWESVVVDRKSSILANYQVVNWPHYVLIDPTGYIISSPALGPAPNGKYETIDQVFFQIKKSMESEKGDGR